MEIELMKVADYLVENFWVITSIILAFTSIILAFITLVLGIKTLNFNKKIAEKQGIFQTPNIRFKLYKSELRDTYNSNKILIATKIPKNGIMMFPLLITLINEGSKSGKEIQLFLRYHKQLRGGGQENAKIIFNKENPPKIYSRVKDVSSSFQVLEIDIGTLTPGQPFPIQDEITIMTGTILKFDVNAVTKDGTPITASMEVQVTHQIDYTIFQDDSEPISGSISLLIIDTSQQSLEEYITKENTRNKKTYDNLNLYQKFKLSNSSKKDGYIYEAITYDESKIKYEAKGQIGRISVDNLKYSYYYRDKAGLMYLIKE